MSLLQGNFEALPEGKQGVVESQTVAIADDFSIRKMITLTGKEVQEDKNYTMFVTGRVLMKGANST